MTQNGNQSYQSLVFWFPVRATFPVFLKDGLECVNDRVSGHDHQQVSVDALVGLVVGRKCGPLWKITRTPIAWIRWTT